MRLLKTLFRREADHSMRRALQKMEDDLNVKRPVFALGDAIANVSLACAKDLHGLYKDGNEGAWQCIFATRDYIIFFSHLASRCARHNHGEESQKELIALLDDGNRKCFMHSLINFPQGMEQNLYNEFSAEFRRKDEYYWRCGSTDELGHCLLSIICDGFGLSENEIRAREAIEDATAKAIARISLKPLVDAAVAALPSIRLSA